MYETSKKEAIKYARDDEIMERYLEESNKVQSIDNGLLRAYDHEQSLIEGMQKQFIEEGIERGKSEARLENAKAFIDRGVDKELVIQTLNLTDDELKELKLN